MWTQSSTGAGPGLRPPERFFWLAAPAMGVLAFIASLTANNLWTIHGEARFAATNPFVEPIEAF